MPCKHDNVDCSIGIYPPEEEQPTNDWMQDFHNEFGLNGLFCKEIAYGDEITDEYLRVQKFITKQIDKTKEECKNLRTLCHENPRGELSDLCSECISDG